MVGSKDVLLSVLPPAEAVVLWGIRSSASRAHPNLTLPFVHLPANPRTNNHLIICGKRFKIRVIRES
jgi:hypothetical protein